jgi:hypothetical protein
MPIASSAALSPAETAAPADWLRRSPLSGVPAWLVSLVLHLTTLTALGLYFQKVQHGVSSEPGRSIGISLATGSSGQTEYFSNEDAAAGGAPAASPAEAVTPSVVEALPRESEAPASAGPALPVASASGSSALPGESELTGSGTVVLPGAGTGKGKSRGGKGIENATQTGVFGVQGVGSRFVYVFDRSSSMLGYGGRPLAAAKRELLASLAKLDKVHQFQVIFYNDRPTLFDPYRSGRPGMFFADDKGKRLAEDFVRGIPADGSTQHVEALKLALRMQPDVIFFLTDGDEPQLRPSELAELRRINRGTSINTIEFGPGPAQRGDNFLKQLARENDGQYGYLDVTQLPEAR